MSYQCPLCHLPLQRHLQQWQCANRHQFDCAKEGYVNLLPVQHKRSKEPGDSSEMIQARRLFLDAGHYQPLQQKVAEVLGQYLAPTAEKLLDIGCGEGYYTAAMAQALNQSGRAIQVYGLDVAKVAVRSAAKRYKSVDFCVASSHRLPFENASLDGILRIYAPCKAEELARVSRVGGIVVTVSPGPRHLYQLKELVYAEVQLHAEINEALPGFVLQEEIALAYRLSLTGDEALQLLQMTPFAWRAPITLTQQLAALPLMDCETDFVIRVFQRQEQAI